MHSRVRIVAPDLLVTLYRAVPLAVSPGLTDDGRRFTETSGVVTVKLDMLWVPQAFQMSETGSS
jgi:hypothetical protein